MTDQFDVDNLGESIPSEESDLQFNDSELEEWDCEDEDESLLWDIEEEDEIEEDESESSEEPDTIDLMTQAEKRIFDSDGLDCCIEEGEK